MAAFDHWLPLHVGDYLADTMHLSTLQHGIYIRLIMHYWKRRSLPADERLLARIAGIPTLKFRVHGGPVVALFTLSEPKIESKPPGVSDSKIDSDSYRTVESKPPGVFDSVPDTIMAPAIPARTLSHKRLDAEIARAEGIFAHRKQAATRSAAGRREGKLNGHEGEHLLPGSTSKCSSPAPERARDSTTTTTKSPPHKPPGGGRGRARNDGFGESYLHDLERANGKPNGARHRPRVVSVAGRLVGD
jgi:uncharacterized protein YdaU (DUF1376 family)